MGFFDFFKKNKTTTETSVSNINIDVKPNTIYQPQSGNVIKLEEIPDPVFSSGALGQGCGIEPDQNIVYSPLNGTIATVAETKHAIGLTGDNGLEMLIHVGIDTVNMNGKGFKPLVTEGQKVKAGDALLEFDKEEIKKAGYPDTTAVLVINAQDYGNLVLEHTGVSQAGSILFKY